MRVTSLGISAVEPGLSAIRGWAYSVEEDFPEGIVEAAGSMMKTSGWSSRTACPATAARQGINGRIDAGFKPL